VLFLRVRQVHGPEGHPAVLLCEMGVLCFVFQQKLRLVFRVSSPEIRLATKLPTLSICSASNHGFMSC
jgi:hypothetical protein